MNQSNRSDLVENYSNQQSSNAWHTACSVVNFQPLPLYLKCTHCWPREGTICLLIELATTASLVHILHSRWKDKSTGSTCLMLLHFWEPMCNPSGKWRGDYRLLSSASVCLRLLVQVWAMFSLCQEGNPSLYCGTTIWSVNLLYVEVGSVLGNQSASFGLRLCYQIILIHNNL